MLPILHLLGARVGLLSTTGYLSSSRGCWTQFCAFYRSQIEETEPEFAQPAYRGYEIDFPHLIKAFVLVVAVGGLCIKVRHIVNAVPRQSYFAVNWPCPSNPRIRTMSVTCSPHMQRRSSFLVQESEYFFGRPLFFLWLRSVALFCTRQDDAIGQASLK